MIETSRETGIDDPKILVIGIGGGGNNALDRMITANIKGVVYAAMNTDIQVLNTCKAEQKIQLGKKITRGHGSGADSDIGEAAAMESEGEITELIKGYDLCIITCGLGGGTGTGAAPVIARCCKELGILTIAVVTTPFSFENTPRINVANQGLNKLNENVDTLLTIPNDKLIGLSEKPLLLEDAFMIADSVLRYTIEGITNIIYNKGMINLDFNDLRTTLAGKGIGHLGIGIVDSGNSILEAVEQAINSPLLDTSIEGASNLLVNTCGKINIADLNGAISHIRKLAGEDVNIIWGTVSSADIDEDKIIVTLIATGMNKNSNELKIPNTNIPILPPDSPTLELIEWKSKTSKNNAPQTKPGIIIPSFLLDTQHKRKI